MSYTAPTRANIDLTGVGWAAPNLYYLDTSQTTSSSVFYEFQNAYGPKTDRGLEIRLVGSETRLYCETSDNTSWPHTVSNDGVNYFADVTISLGQTLSFLQGFSFVVTSDLLWSLAPNTNTEGSTSSCHLTYDPVQNSMQAFLNATLDSTDLVSTRNLYYRVRNATTNNVSADFNMNHTSGTHTYLNFDPTVNGTYELQKVLTNPLEVFICDSAVVNTFPASDDSPENDPPPTPVFIRGSSRRGNLNFW